ncbi:MAG: SGNH/GDSL hydrolase family protein [Thermoanaerobaculia bacterium]
MSMTRFFSVLFLLAGASHCGFSSPAGPKAPTPAMSMTYLALGDSYTIGEGVAAAERWPNQLAAALREGGIRIDDPQIIARTGWTTGELSAAIDAESPKGPFGLVTLLIGVNNQYRGRDVNEYRGEFAALLSRAIGFAGGDARHVVVVSIPDWGATPFAEGRDRARIASDIDAYNGVNRQETAKAGARYVDITPISRRGASMVVADGLHPSAGMYAQWVSAILPEARAALSGGSASGNGS